jgi:translation initiation factor IF-2
MGHVDHGKTSLLDTIRKTNVVKGEHGGITQHIGAYQVSVPTPNGKKGEMSKITFIDTPGHAAFDKMRARGASLTDIAILLVAGDDGVMPQTIEAIKHIQKHDLPMIVAVNKMDKKESNVEKVKEQLASHNVLTEEWGGSAILVPISATTGKGIDKLLEMILLVAEMHEYRANPTKGAQGVIIDARKDANAGGIVTLLVQNGTLHVGDTIMAGTASGKVRKMTDENGKSLRTASPSTPVQILGFNEVPKAGDMCYVADEKLTKQVVLERKDKEKLKLTKSGAKAPMDIDAIASLDMKAKKQLNVIIKADVSGSVEAITQSIKAITSDEVTVNVISSGVGIVNDNDVALSQVANALLIAFDVKTSPTAEKLAKKEKTEIHTFNVIYQIFDFVTEKMVRMFTPKFNEIYYGFCEVRAIFKSSAIGLIAGCMVKDGKIVRGAKARLKRKDKLVGEYTIDSLKIVKDDAKEVQKGFECGVKMEGATVEVGDVIECIGKEQQPIIYGGKKYEF